MSLFIQLFPLDANQRPKRIGWVGHKPGCHRKAYDHDKRPDQLGTMFEDEA
jgi:hypothetical protein